MALTQTDFINMKLAAEGELNRSDIVRGLIQNDVLSPQKVKMKEGEQYYIGEHDVLQKNFRQGIVSETTGEGQEEFCSFKNPNRSNHHNVNPFHRVLVEQKISYIAGREPSVSVDGATENPMLEQYEKHLSRICDEEFNDQLQDLIAESSNKGYGVLHIYYDERGKFQYTIIPSEEVILIYDTKYQRNLEEVIRYYDIAVIRNGRKHLRKRVEWWTKEDVTYYVETENDRYQLDYQVSYNPCPHWLEVNPMTHRTETHSWGRVPFVVLDNNRKQTTDLQCIKGLIDAYDLISSEGTNNFLDLVELYWVIEGYGGDTASAIARKLQINKANHVGIQIQKEGNSYYHPLEKMIYLRDDFEEFEAIHEVAHALEDIEGIWEDPQFRILLKDISQSHMVSDIIEDTETFVKPIYRIVDDRFISEYQGRMYIKNKGTLADGRINPDLLWEYFSEGYRCYFSHQDILMMRDPELYVYIDRMVQE